jgi:hypothetical protein
MLEEKRLIGSGKISSKSKKGVATKSEGPGFLQGLRILQGSGGMLIDFPAWLIPIESLVAVGRRATA